MTNCCVLFCVFFATQYRAAGHSHRTICPKNICAVAVGHINGRPPEMAVIRRELKLAEGGSAIVCQVNISTGMYPLTNIMDVCNSMNHGIAKSSTTTSTFGQFFRFSQVSMLCSATSTSTALTTVTPSFPFAHHTRNVAPVFVAPPAPLVPPILPPAVPALPLHCMPPLQSIIPGYRPVLHFGGTYTSVAAAPPPARSAPKRRWIQQYFGNASAFRLCRHNMAVFILRGCFVGQGGCEVRFVSKYTHSPTTVGYHFTPAASQVLSPWFFEFSTYQG